MIKSKKLTILLISQFKETFMHKKFLRISMNLLGFAFFSLMGGNGLYGMPDNEIVAAHRTISHHHEANRLFLTRNKKLSYRTTYKGFEHLTTTLPQDYWDYTGFRFGLIDFDLKPIEENPCQACHHANSLLFQWREKEQEKNNKILSERTRLIEDREESWGTKIVNGFKTFVKGVVSVCKAIGRGIKAVVTLGFC